MHKYTIEEIEEKLGISRKDIHFIIRNTPNRPFFKKFKDVKLTLYDFDEIVKAIKEARE